MIKSETICALSTPAGIGAIAVIRISGPETFSIVGKLVHFSNPEKKLAKQKANTLHYCRFVSKGEIIDEVVLSLFRGPYSYTGEDVIEVSCHGSVYIQQKILEALVRSGCRMANPGEYTQRAFLNGKMDLSQAEAVADLIASGTSAAHQLALQQMRGGFSEEIRKLRDQLLQFISLIELELDFSEEDVEFADRERLESLLQQIAEVFTALISSFEYGNVIKNGVPVAIIGRTNAGKSTLLNRLLRDDKAIVSDIHGTTRDSIEDTIQLQGIEFRFIDTAGLRDTSDFIENEGIQRTYKKYEQAKIVIVLIDATDDFSEVDRSLNFLRKGDSKKHIIFALNKSDLLDVTSYNACREHYERIWGPIGEVVPLSARMGLHLEELEKTLVKLSLTGKEEESVVVTNVRHYEALLMSSQALGRAKEGLKNGLPTDLLAQDIREILHYLGEITGDITTDEILGNIFKNFCIGK